MIKTWQTWKKETNPQLYSVQDNLFGTKMIVEPTMRHYGFLVATREREYINDTELMKPRDNVIEILKNENIKYDNAIYHTYKSRTGLVDYIEIFYK